MNIIKPLQLMGKQTVIEQDNKFHFVVSVSLGFRLQSGESVLEMDAMSESIPVMGNNPMPDFGMPKPKAEYLVSGSYYVPDGIATRAGEVKAEFAGRSKSLYVFGDRQWEMGIPSQPELMTQMELDYSRAFGGSEYTKNPQGMGYQQEQLPNIEHPDQLLSSANSQVAPAGFAVLDPMAEQRTQYQGTYDDTYLQKYYPGYPVDLDWRYFMCTAKDQWSDDFYSGTESFALHNMHPDKPLISGQLPGYKARCFAMLENKTDLIEVNLNLDTVWFFPEKDLGILIWRGGFDVNDDEAEEVSQLMMAYENIKDTAREKSHYDAVFLSLNNSSDSLMSQLSSDDLIPLGEQCALQKLQDNALQNREQSEFDKNMEAKAASITDLTKSKIDEAIKQAETNLPVDGPLGNQALLDIEKYLKNAANPEIDSDTEKLNKILEKILPGITGGDPKKIQLKGFTFDKLDEMMTAMDDFLQKKQDIATEQVNKAKEVIRCNIEDQMNASDQVDEAVKKNLQDTLTQLEQIDNPPAAPLPRVDANAILNDMGDMSAQSMEAMQNLENMKAMGGDDEAIKQIKSMLQQSIEEQEQVINQRLHEVEREFKTMYLEVAHYQENGIVPHHARIIEREKEFLQALESVKGVSRQDWSGLDLSGLELDGVNLSDCFLEQVDFSKSSLRGANLSGAILARANLDNADFSGCNLQNTNIGAVSAKGTNFSDCKFDTVTLSKGDFSSAKFNKALLDEVQILDIIIDYANFSEATLNGFQFINIDMKGVDFSGAKLPSACFMQCKLEQCNFSKSILQSTIWADSALKQINFDWADMTSACFASSNPAVIKLEQVSFAASCLDKANFQGIDMQKSNLSNASIIQANFSSANLYGSNLSGTVAHKTIFRKAILTNTNMDKIDLREGSMGKAHLTGASVTGANLFAVDFLRSTVGDTLFNDSILDNTIIQDWRP